MAVANSTYNYLEFMGSEKMQYDPAKVTNFSNAIEGVLNKFGNRIVKDLRENLDIERHVASGSLSDSIVFEIIPDANGVTYEFLLKLNEYYKFVDKGVRGSKQSVLAPNSPYQFKGLNIKKGVVLGWMKQRNITLAAKTKTSPSGHKVSTTAAKKAAKPKDTALAYIIGRSIATRGLITTNFYSSVINDDTLKQLTEALRQALKKDVLVTMAQNK